MSKEGRMATATVEMEIDLPAGVTIREYQRIDDGHCFHVSWELPTVCRCETCRREAPLDLVEKNKFLAIRDLDLWGQPSFFVYQEVLALASRSGAGDPQVRQRLQPRPLQGPASCLSRTRRA